MHTIKLCSHKLRRRKTYTVHSKGVGRKSGMDLDTVYMRAISGQQQRQQSNIYAAGMGKKQGEGNDDDDEREMTERVGDENGEREVAVEIAVSESL